MFHFSGYGSQLKDPNCDESNCLTSTLVAVDNLDITKQTIKLVMAAVNKVLLSLRQIAPRGLVTLDTSDNLIDFINNLLADLNTDADTTTYKLDKTQLAVMSLVFEVV